MEKDKKIVNRVFIETTFRPILSRAIAIYVLMMIGKLKASVTIKGNVSIDKRIEAIHIFLHGDKAKRHLLMNLRDYTNIKIDIIAEILKQYSMLHGSLATADHDTMCQLFDEEMKIIRDYVSSSRYDEIYEIAREVQTLD